MLRYALLCSSLLVLLGCGYESADPRHIDGAMVQIEYAYGDLNELINSPDFRLGEDLGDDRLGWAVLDFQKAAKGTDMEEDAQRLFDKVSEVSTFATQRPKVDDLKVKVKELGDLIAEVKAKL